MDFFICEINKYKSYVIGKYININLIDVNTFIFCLFCDSFFCNHVSFYYFFKKYKKINFSKNI